MQSKFTVLLLLISTWLLSCIGPLTEVWVVVETNIPVSLNAMTPGLESIHLTATVGGQVISDRTVSLSAGTFALPGHFVIRPTSSSEGRPVELVVEGIFRDPTMKVPQRAVFTFARGRRLLLRIWLAAECTAARQMECAAMSMVCGQGGNCSSAERRELPEYTPEELGMRGDASVPLGDVVTSAMVSAPRLMRPLSGSVMSSKKPAIKWENVGGIVGARVEFFTDRACTQPIAGQSGFEATGTTFTPTIDLPSGTVFFRLRGRTVGGVFSEATTPVWQMRIPRVVPNPMTVVDTVIRTDADYNGDGFADIAYDATVGAARTLNLIFGNAMGNFTRGGSIATTASPAVIGDVNGDGFVDLAVGTAMGLRIYNGNIDSSQILQGGTNVAWPSGGISNTVAPSGDADRDGYADFLLGAPSTPLMALTSVGQGYLYRGGIGSPVPVDLARGNAMLDQLGLGLSAGDLDGDGAIEFAVSAPFATASRTGVVQLIKYSLATNMLASSGQLSMNPTTLNAHMGRIVAMMGDNNGDGRADILVNANEYDMLGREGAVGWKPGATPITPTIPRFITGTATQHIGTTIAQLGDLNGDGLGDLAISRETGTGAMPLPSEVMIYRGVNGAQPMLVAPSFITGDLATMTVVGAKIGGIGDFNADGFDDFVCTIAGPAPSMNSLRLFSGAMAFPLMNVPVASGTINGVASSN